MVFEVIDGDSIPTDNRVRNSTWACKLKSNGTKCCRCNARGVKQVDGQSYDSLNIHTPLTNTFTMRLVLVLMELVGWVAHSVDVKRTFLQ